MLVFVTRLFDVILVYTGMDTSTGNSIFKSDDPVGREVVNPLNCSGKTITIILIQFWLFI